MAARMWIWPRYVIEVNGKRVRLPNKSGAAIARLFQSAGSWVSMSQLIDACYFDDPEGGPVTADNCVRVRVFKMRRLLGKLGIRIDGKQGCPIGYRLILP